MLGKKICHTYLSKHYSNRVKQVTLLTFPKGEKRIAKFKGGKAKSERQRWHYHTVKRLSALLREITSKHYSDFYC